MTDLLARNTDSLHFSFVNSLIIYFDAFSVGMFLLGHISVFVSTTFCAKTMNPLTARYVLSFLQFDL